MPSLTAFLFGGLGNQLFQYAAGRALSLRNNLPLIIDESGFEFDIQYRRTLELQKFQVMPGLQVTSSLWKFKLSRIIRRLATSAPVAARLARPALIVEKSLVFDPMVLQVPILHSASMMGYWQDERYFLNARSTIVQEFRPARPLSPQNAEIAARIRTCASPVAVHIRHRHGMSGEARDTPQALAERIRKCITLPQQYYVRGMAMISEMVQDPCYFVFSDDPEWTRQNFQAGDNFVLLESGRGPDHEDMILMSYCAHHLIANSSFSWWGAWLAENVDKVVIAPKGFHYTPNIPEHWVSI